MSQVTQALRPMRTCAATLVIVTALGACGGSGTASYPPPTPPAAPAITGQPANQSVPMGLSATYSVSATGSQLTYQWARDGMPIAGAMDSTYTTAATAFTDTGANFTVTVSNPGGSAVSNPASLTVTARAPANGDLRFQQVDAPSTVNGWGNAGVGVSTNLLARSDVFWSPALGSAFYVGGGNCSSPPVTDGTGCTWFLSEMPLSGASNITAAYGSDTLDDYAADLADPSWPFSQIAAAGSSQSVINALDIEPASNLFAVGFVSSPQASGYSLLQESVTPAGLQAALTQLGAMSRVVTAISYNAGLITLFAYAWQADTATIYEATAATISPADAPAAAGTLAAQGYIVTASGLADGAGNVVLVGTRVQGDMMARPFMAANSNDQYQQLQAGGYTVVAVIQDPAASYAIHYLYER